MPKIISIHSFRGGTGKSNLTANLTVALACQGKRVGAIDTDIQSPGIHVLFGLEESKMPRTLNDYLWGRCNIEETAIEVSPEPVQAAGGAIFLIPASIKAGEIARILHEGYDVGLLNDGIRRLVNRLKLDYLVIDTHPGINEETLISITISDLLLIVLRPDQQDFQGTAVTVEIARELEVPDMLLVVNKVLPSYDFAAVQKQVENTYKAKVAGVLPLCEEMIDLASRDVFYLRYRDHPLAKSLHQVAEHLWR